jgi:NADH dehydrogenase (ubiquinone) 1 alpha/beta subcomplex 1, acyl-carrier protein
VIRVIASLDCIKENQEITLNSTWTELGIDELTKVELFLEIETEFIFEFPCEELEKFKNVGDAVEYISQSFFSR